MRTYTLAGGCFWCLDAVYQRMRGVVSVVSGYTGGALLQPQYYQVARGDTGHAEAVQVTFDETVIPSDIVLDIFFLIHDPTSLNRQGADVGTLYRSAMFYTDNTQKATFEAARKRAQENLDSPIVTEITPLETFYPAEPEHQDYFTNNPATGYCSVVVAPKVVKARSEYSDWFKEASEEL